MVYAITGGPGFGKTNLLNILEKKGFRVCPEEARSILDGSSSFPEDFDKRIAGMKLSFLQSTLLFPVPKRE